MNILLLSGGVDSMVLLAQQQRDNQGTLCVSFDYGQRHRKELEAAKLIANYYDVNHWTHTLPASLFAGSALTGRGDVPTGLHFTDLRQTATVVPNRNMVFLSLAGAMAKSWGAKAVLFAAHAGDAAVYPDCRSDFVKTVSTAMELACGVSVVAPFLGMTKREIVALGKHLSAPFRLAWSCYQGGTEPCGQCGACIERTEAGA